MSELKRTQLYEIHVAAGASMVDFGGLGNARPISQRHCIRAPVYTSRLQPIRRVPHGAAAGGRTDRLAFLQHVLTSNVAGLDLNMAQYCIIPAPRRQRRG